MTTLTTLFSIVQYNNYNELDNIIKSNKVDLKNITKKSEYLIPNAIKYRSKECFDLLVESKYFDPNNNSANGLQMALEYYCNSKNESNSYYINKLKTKGIAFNRYAIQTIIQSNSFDEFSNYIVAFINESPAENIKTALISCLNNIDTFKKVLNIGLSLNVITYNLASYVIQYASIDKKLTIMIEFSNCGINLFDNEAKVKNYLINNIQDPSATKYIVDNVLLQNPNMDLSTVIVDYLNLDGRHYKKSDYFCFKIFNIYSAYHFLTKLNCDLFGKTKIAELIINNFAKSFKIDWYETCLSTPGNNLLVIIKLFDLLLEDKFIDNTTVINKIVTLDNFTKKTSYGKKETTYNFSGLQYILYLLKYLESKGINIKAFDDFFELKIPTHNIINVGSLIPKKLKTIKFKG